MQPATPLRPELVGIIQALRRHLRLLRRYGPAATYDAVLTGFLICGHLWTDQSGEWPEVWQRWTRRAEVLIPPGSESTQFSAARIFAAAYPEALTLASLIASPAWRSLAAGDPAQQRQFTAAIGQRLGRPGYQPQDTSDPIAHWMTYDSWQPPSRPHTTFPQTRPYGSSPARAATTSRQSLQRHERSTLWFRLYRRGGRAADLQREREERYRQDRESDGRPAGGSRDHRERPRACHRTVRRRAGGRGRLLDLRST